MITYKLEFEVFERAMKHKDARDIMVQIVEWFGDEDTKEVLRVELEKYGKPDLCSGSVYIRGYCVKHYHRARERGEFGGELCSEPGCELYEVTRGFCLKHYARARNAGELKIGHGVCSCGGKATADDGYCASCRPVVSCSVVGCLKPVKSKGLCGAHYQAERRRGI